MATENSLERNILAAINYTINLSIGENIKRTKMLVNVKQK